MKTFKCCIVLLFIAVSAVYSQQHEKPLVKRFSLKGNIELSNYALIASSDLTHRQWVVNYGSSLRYDHNNKVTFEAEYKYISEANYYDSFGNSRMMNNQGDKYYYSVDNFLRSHVVNLKANYFVNNDRWEDPVYFIGGLSLALQPVRKFQNYRFIDENGLVESEVTVRSDYNKFLVGPMAGVGLYFDTGFISFTSEFTFGTRVAIGNDSKLTETSFNLSFSPILKF
jgi:hypothetical protein